MRMQKAGRRRMSMSALDWARKLWLAIDTPVSLSCEILARYGEYRQLVEKSIDPRVYQTPSLFFLDYQAVKALSKYPYLDTGIDKQAVAYEKFLDAERQCSQTNERLRTFSASIRLCENADDVRQVFHLARHKIAKILGAVPKLEELSFKFGPGASFGVRGDTSVYKKLTSALECTFAFTPILQEFLEEFPGWIPEGSHTVELCAGSELTFVPKDAKTDRPICIEPLLNGLYQKGFGSYIRNRLLRHGVDLRDQGINQRLAMEAERLSLSTIDFSSASDTIAYMLVLELLPIDWVAALDVARSPSYVYRGASEIFQKFTSMGNAYTFELETLIFYALATAACEVKGCFYQTGENLHVYGDDVIIPRAAFDLFSEVSAFAGFTINPSKSYKDGVFFESCGSDWFLGRAVRPFLLKKRIQTLQDFYYVTNTTLAICERYQSLRDWDDDGSFRRRLDRLRDVHAWCVGCIPRDKRLLVPKGIGDIGLASDFDVACPIRHREWDGWVIRGAIPVPIRIVVEDWPMAYALYHAGAGCPVGWWDAREQITHSLGYTPRYSEVVPPIRIRKIYVPGEWATLPVKWSDRAISLCRRNVRAPRRKA